MTQDQESKPRLGALGKGLLVIGLAVVAAVVLGMFITGGRDKAESDEHRAKFSVRRGDLGIRVSESGTLRTADPIKILAEITGQATIVELVEEGTRVKEGDLLVRLDASQLEEREAQQEIELENAQARLVQAAEDKRIQELNNESEIASAKLAVENARMGLEKYGKVAIDAEGFLDEEAYESGAAPPKGEAYQAFRDAELEITRAQTQLGEAGRDFDGMDELLEKGFVTRNDYISAELKVLENTRNVESSYLKHHLLKTYNYPKQRAQLDADLTKADADLKQTKLTTVSRLRQKGAAIEQAQRLHDMRKEQLEETQDQLSKMTITAPEEGLVIYGDERRWWERDRIKIGGTVSRGTVILTLPRVSKMLAAVEIAEKDIGKIKLDQVAVITMSALPEMTISGKVKRIANVASESNRWRGSDVKSFEIEVAMDEANEKMKPGMSCEVELTIDTLEDVLYVPVNAVYKHGERDVCFIIAAGVVETVSVMLGQSGEIYVEVAEGLTEGDEVLLYEAKPASLQDAEVSEGPPADERAEDAGAEDEDEAKEDEADQAGDEEAEDGDTADEDAAEAVSEEKAETGDAVGEGETETVSDEEAEEAGGAEKDAAEAVSEEKAETGDAVGEGETETVSDEEAEEAGGAEEDAAEAPSDKQAEAADTVREDDAAQAGDEKAETEDEAEAVYDAGDAETPVEKAQPEGGAGDSEAGVADETAADAAAGGDDGTD